MIRNKKWRYIFAPFSLIYCLVTSLRNLFYALHIFREYSLDARVISVGNITWGGTGKTPAVLFILKGLLKQGKRPAVLIRGYGDDETRLLTKLAPGVGVIAGKDRVRKGREAIARYGADTLLLDDGFQHRRLKRDLDIVCIDAVDPFGNAWLIPAGSMREGLGALKRADIFLITKADLVNVEELQKIEERLRKINTDALIVKSVHKVTHFYKLSDEQLVDVEYLKEKELVLVSAVGSPEAFERTVQKIGLKYKRHFIFRDHHWYTDRDLKEIESYCITHAIDTIITTEKDAIRLQTVNCTLYTVHFIALNIDLKLTQNEDAFTDRLFRIYNS